MTFLTSTLAFITFAICVKGAIEEKKLKKRILIIIGSLFPFLLGVIYF